jgi:hypothetical protein
MACLENATTNQTLAAVQVIDTAKSQVSFGTSATRFIPPNNQGRHAQPQNEFAVPDIADIGPDKNDKYSTSYQLSQEEIDWHEMAIGIDKRLDQLKQTSTDKPTMQGYRVYLTKRLKLKPGMQIYVDAFIPKLKDDVTQVLVENFVAHQLDAIPCAAYSVKDGGFIKLLITNWKEENLILKKKSTVARAYVIGNDFDTDGSQVIIGSMDAEEICERINGGLNSISIDDTWGDEDNAKLRKEFNDMDNDQKDNWLREAFNFHKSPELADPTVAKLTLAIL